MWFTVIQQYLGCCQLCVYGVKKGASPGIIMCRINHFISPVWGVIMGMWENEWLQWGVKCPFEKSVFARVCCHRTGGGPHLGVVELPAGLWLYLDRFPKVTAGVALLTPAGRSQRRSWNPECQGGSLLDLHAVNYPASWVGRVQAEKPLRMGL